MQENVLHLLKLHDYFHGLSDLILQEVVDLGEEVTVNAGEIVHEIHQPFTTVCFVIKGRLKAVRVDSNGHEHFFRSVNRGDQYGLMAAALGEAIPMRVIALEPSLILRLDHARALDLPLKHPELRMQWIRSFARSLQQHFLGSSPRRAPNLVAVFHQSSATRPLARQLVQRLRQLGEDICVLSDSDEWATIPDLTFRSLREGDHFLSPSDVRQQISEWSQAQRILVEHDTAVDPERIVRMLEAADRVLLFVRPQDIAQAISRFRTQEIQVRGWRDKLSIVWQLDTNNPVAPLVPGVNELAHGDFKVSNDTLPAPWGTVLANGLERLVHSLRGVRIGVALGGGAARGMAHLGVLKALEQNGIVVDEIAGTSAGALTGILYSSGLDCDYTANQFATDLRPSWFFRWLPSGNYWYLLYKYRRGKFNPMLRKYLHDWKLEQLPLPCQGVTVDLVAGQAVIRDRGDAVHAILESINLPGLSQPICRNGQALIDGGLMNNIPADVLISRGCNFVIAVSVSSRIEHKFGDNTPDTPTLRMRTPSVLNTLLRSFMVQSYNLNAIGVKDADVSIEPDVTEFDLSEFMRAKELAAVGEKATLEQVPRIKKLLSRMDPALFHF